MRATTAGSQRGTAVVLHVCSICTTRKGKGGGGGGGGRDAGKTIGNLKPPPEIEAPCSALERSSSRPTKLLWCRGPSFSEPSTSKTPRPRASFGPFALEGVVLWDIVGGWLPHLLGTLPCHVTRSPLEETTIGHKASNPMLMFLKSAVDALQPSKTGHQVRTRVQPFGGVRVYGTTRCQGSVTGSTLPQAPAFFASQAQVGQEEQFLFALLLSQRAIHRLHIGFHRRGAVAAISEAAMCRYAPL